MQGVIGRWGRGLALGLVTAGLFAAAPALSADKARGHVRLATWNIANLHHEEGVSVPGRGVYRTREDFTWLRHYAFKLNADIVALQEINSRAAAHRLFSRGGWTVLISGRKAVDLDTYDLTGEWPDASIYTGIAVRKGLTILNHRDVASLEVMHVDPDDGVARPTRRAVEVEIEKDGQRLIVLSVHLKSGCFTGPMSTAETGDHDCDTLANQMGPLRAWIEEKAAGAVPFVILGDFNRAIDVAGDEDALWQAIADGGPALTRFPGKRAGECWKDSPPAPYYRDPIDHIVLSPGAAALAVESSFGWITFDPSLGPHYQRISDHCPAYIDLEFRRDDARRSIPALRRAGLALLRNGLSHAGPQADAVRVTANGS